MKTTVVNVGHNATCDIYIGRACGSFGQSRWHNPFRIGIHGTREQVLAKYKTYLKANYKLSESIHTLKGKRLGCWCAPNACHGDLLARLAEGEETL